MSVLIVGSVALDDLETPYGVRKRALGGSATYASIASSYFTNDNRFVGIVGGDFPDEHIELLKGRKIDLTGLEIVKDGNTFSWGGKYHDDMNERDTLFTELGVFETFEPKIPEEWRKSDYLLLGNIHPGLQLAVLDQVEDPDLVICDTMNLWINISRDELIKTIGRVDILILNDQEAKMLTEDINAIKAGKKILEMGPSHVVVKKGEHGAVLMSKDQMFVAPAIPLDELKDPTGAGDVFAGGFAGYLVQTRDHSFENLKRAVLYGTTLASYCVQEFSVEGLGTLTKEQIDTRAHSLIELAACSLP